MILKFVKESSNKWYIDLPDWMGKKSALQMVSGADILLDYMAEGRREVTILADTMEFEGASHLDLIKKCWFNGADYKIDMYKNYQLKLDVWLCNVTKHVLGDFPETIYFEKID